MNVGNWPLLVATIEHVLDHPEEHDQEDWISDCGTRRCIAGWVTHLAGYEALRWRDIDPEWNSDKYGHNDFHGTVRRSVPRYYGQDLLPGGGYEITIAEAADIELGTGSPHDDFTDLYDGGNTIEDILQIVNEWAREDGFELPERLKVELP